MRKRVTISPGEAHNLQESKARLEEAERVAHIGYWIWDLKTDRVT